MWLQSVWLCGYNMWLCVYRVCGCGAGDSGCSVCGVCRSCAGEGVENDDKAAAALLEAGGAEGGIFEMLAKARGDNLPLDLFIGRIRQNGVYNFVFFLWFYGYVVISLCCIILVVTASYTLSFSLYIKIKTSMVNMH